MQGLEEYQHQKFFPSDLRLLHLIIPLIIGNPSLHSGLYAIFACVSYCGCLVEAICLRKILTRHLADVSVHVSELTYKPDTATRHLALAKSDTSAWSIFARRYNLGSALRLSPMRPWICARADHRADRSTRGPVPGRRQPMTSPQSLSIMLKCV